MARTMQNPGAGDAGACGHPIERSDDRNHSRKIPKPATRVIVHGEAGRRVVTLRGRPAWTLAKLIAAGDRGITALDCPPGCRLAHYVYRLRGEGIVISTEHEEHGGEFAGRHARYRLASPVRVERAG